MKLFDDLLKLAGLEQTAQQPAPRRAQPTPRYTPEQLDNAFTRYCRDELGNAGRDLAICKDALKDLCLGNPDDGKECPAAPYMPRPAPLPRTRATPLRNT